MPPLGYLAPVCAALLVLSVWLAIGLRYRHFRQNRRNNGALDLERMPFRHRPSVISKGEVEKQFPLVKYCDWEANHEATKKEIGSLHSMSDAGRADSVREEKAHEALEHATKPDTGGPPPPSPSDRAQVDSGYFDTNVTCETLAPQIDDLSCLCAICMEGFEGDNYIRPLTCGHIFHPPCVDPWLTKRRASCPLCNKAFSGHSAERREPVVASPRSFVVLPAPRAAMIRGDIFPRTI
ncbi:hypothetical protein BDV25DRAFT_159238 [Aspergillus avenaceus]|uniref:RING-type domain-containing protein n=1 Tax=Aspergillus avenaceus TaxID=36643 RepID=A0A5N6TNP1_ASPAV|nr:hypothetical protein BDV25DRAFT_159238 [Aspergillus avenaceus]